MRAGDGYLGWPEAAPFDAIIVTAAPDHIPQPLVDQLKVGGRLVIPVGEHYQELLQCVKTPQGLLCKSIIPVRFVPLTGEGSRRNGSRRLHSPLSERSTATKASWGMFTLPMVFMRFFPSFCFSRSLRLREMSPP